MSRSVPASGSADAGFGWFAIVRLGLVQAALGGVVVLTTSTLNRVMVVELALPALVPGLLVAWHYIVQMARPRLGHGSDGGSRRTPWIVGGIIVLAMGAAGASVATAWMASAPTAGLVLALAAFSLVGIGVSASGTSLLVLLAKRVAPSRRSAAAAVVWLVMIVGFAVTAGVAGRLLDPYSPARLIAVACGVGLAAVLLTLVAMFRLEGPAVAAAPQPASEGVAKKLPFRAALAEVWREPVARRFTVFVFVSMLAYSAQDLILEPFAGTVFGFTPGQSTGLSGVQHGGVLLGMLAAALAGRGGRFGSLAQWQVGGCLASALALCGLVAAAAAGPGWPLRGTVFLLGAANGAYAISAIASMMRLAAEGGGSREGIRMGLWGAAQALAFGFGGLAGTAASDLAHWLLGTPSTAYGLVFGGEALLFIAAAWLARRLGTEANGASSGARFGPFSAARARPADTGRAEPAAARS